MSRFDVFKSWVRSAADSAVDRLSHALPLDNVQDLIKRLTQQQARIREETLTSAAAHAHGVRQASVSCLSERLLVDATLDAGRDVQFSLRPLSARFAAGGAKEISFGIEPPGQAHAELVGAIAGCIAQATWPMAFSPDTMDVAGAIVERDGDDQLRVDLRTVPAVRKFATRGPAAMILDVMQLDHIECVPGAIVLKLKLPPLSP